MDKKIPSKSNSKCMDTYAQVQAYSLCEIDLQINLVEISKQCKGRPKKPASAERKMNWTN